MGWLIYNSNQHVDFYLPKHNIVIECQGIQHFESVKFFGGEENFNETVLRDKNKLSLCTENGIKNYTILIWVIITITLMR